jgi:hypothetical protein
MRRLATVLNVTSPDGQILKVDVPNPRQVEALARGAEAWLEYATRDAVVLERGE